jgi:L-asparaginase II
VHAFVPVAVTDRSGFDESVHFGAAVAIDGSGTVLFAAGDPDVRIYPRSSLKPLQVDAMLRLGFDGTDRQLAIACSSHGGEPVHLDVVRSVLSDVGLTPSALQTTAAWPSEAAAAEAVIATGATKSPLFMNCSGKHAAMLATCVRQGWPTDTYRDVDHPLQRAIAEHVEALAGPIAGIGVDGCGAPTHVLSLAGLARAFSSLASSRARAWSAMVAHPELVGSDLRSSTRMMRAVPELMAKDGAEGVFAAALPDGRAVAVKISDGAYRAGGVVAAAALAAVGVDIDPSEMGDPVLGHGRPVGALRPLIGPEPV